MKFIRDMIDSFTGGFHRGVDRGVLYTGMYSSDSNRKTVSRGVFFMERTTFVGIGMLKHEVDEFLSVSDKFWFFGHTLDNVFINRMNGAGLDKHYNFSSMSFTELVNNYWHVCQHNIERLDYTDEHFVKIMLKGMIYQYLKQVGDKRRQAVLSILCDEPIMFDMDDAKADYVYLVHVWNEQYNK